MNTPLVGATSVLQMKLGGCHYSLQPPDVQQHECDGLNWVAFSSLLDSPRCLLIPPTPGALGSGQIQLRLLVSCRMWLGLSVGRQLFWMLHDETRDTCKLQLQFKCKHMLYTQSVLFSSLLMMFLVQET